MRRNRAERTAAKAAAHDLHRIFHDLERRYLLLPVRRVWAARVGQAVHAIHLVLPQRQRRRVGHHALAPVILHQTASVVRIRFEVRDLRHLGKRRFVCDHLLVTRQRERVVRGRRFACPHPVHHAAHVAQIAHRFAVGEAARDFDDRPLPHAVHQEVGLGVENDRAADLVTPIVVMGEPPQAGLDTAGDHRHAGVGFAGALAISQSGPIRSPPDPAARAVRVVVAHFAVGGVVVDHRVHVAGANGKEQPRPAERPPGFAVVPVGLTDDADAKSLTLEQPAQ